MDDSAREGCARVAPVVDRKSLRSASLFSQTSCTGTGFFSGLGEMSGRGADEFKVGCCVAEESGYLKSTDPREMGECRWRRARVGVE